MESVHVIRLGPELLQIGDHLRGFHLRDLVQGRVGQNLEDGEVAAFGVARDGSAPEDARKSVRVCVAQGRGGRKNLEL